MKRYIIDRIEENMAVCEIDPNSFVNIELKNLPTGVRAGDVVVCNGDSCTIDKEQTEKTREEVIRLQNRLFRRG
ncbi:MAG: DUF3006 domain-containing protein [Oscillospiraceae bacterium]|nr:DUF3006 domain-containing protein [Oscillospiraceae bacterium]